MKIFPILFLFWFQLNAQYPLDAKRDYIWLLGYDHSEIIPEGEGIKIDFHSSPPDVSFFMKDMNFAMTDASICDTSGSMLFYTNGVWVADAMDELMPNGDTLNPGDLEWEWGEFGYRLDQGALILPVPSSSSLYLIIHEPVDYSNDSYQYKIPLLYYTLVDMSLNNGKGAVVAKNQVILNDRLDFGKLTAVRHANGRDWWIIAPTFHSNSYYRYLLSPQGLQLIGLQSVGEISDSGLGQAVFSPDGSVYARVNLIYIGQDNFLDIYHFDRCDGMFSDPVQITYADSAGCGGVAISPNSRYLYVFSCKKTYQFDLQAANIPESKVTVAVWDGYASPFTTNFFLGQLAPDGKIYVNSSNGVDVLHVINNPDQPGLACDFCQHCLQLPSYNAFSLPNYPNFRLGPIDGSPCDTLGIDQLPVGIREAPRQEGVFAVYPNPASSVLYVSSATESKGGAFILFDATGREVLHKLLSSCSPGSEQRIELGNLPAGLYFFKIETAGHQVQTGKVVVVGE